MEQYYGPQPGFWRDFIVIMGAIIFLLSGIPAIIRRIIGAERRKWFSNNYINDFHKKGDKLLRIVFMFVLMAVAIVFMRKPLIAITISIFCMIIQLSFQTYVEWKYAENRKNYVVSLIEIGLTFVVLIWVLFWIDKNL
ncbi:DUF4181 domain-containing protein [Virgibacillus ndiopensis]|uniref:DUF4181 domain-containing protein n=1 Tax=Virgibacillus ndiopensis TaxID=2004408 RepID=UPI000C07E54A|nr:DUF4181 domain-containing protein [Virgibacillus ndiopensis]